MNIPSGTNAPPLGGSMGAIASAGFGSDEAVAKIGGGVCVVSGSAADISLFAPPESSNDNEKKHKLNHRPPPQERSASWQRHLAVEAGCCDAEAMVDEIATVDITHSKIRADEELVGMGCVSVGDIDALALADRERCKRDSSIVGTERPPKEQEGGGKQDDEPTQAVLTYASEASDCIASAQQPQIATTIRNAKDGKRGSCSTFSVAVVSEPLSDAVPRNLTAVDLVKCSTLTDSEGRSHSAGVCSSHLLASASNTRRSALNLLSPSEIPSPANISTNCGEGESLSSRGKSPSDENRSEPLQSATNLVRSGRSTLSSEKLSRQSSLRLSGASHVSDSCSRRSSRILSIPANLGRDELSLNKLKFSRLGLYGRDLEILKLKEAYDNVRFRKQSEGEQCGGSRQGTHSAVTPARRAIRRSGLVQPSAAMAALSQRGSEASSSAHSSNSSSSSASMQTGLPRELILIAGRSGCGKSALATHIRGHVRRTGGFFATGKFDAVRTSEPYTAFTRAFSGLCEEIMAMAQSKRRDDCDPRNGEDSTSRFLKMQSTIRDAVGSEVGILAEVVPNLGQIIGPEGYDLREKTGFSQGDFEGTKNRFQFAMRQFLRAVCAESPLLLFLDDLQWADAASLDLLKNLLADRENANLLVLGSFRDNEVAFMDHPFNVWLQGVQGCEPDASSSVSQIDLGNIDADAVNELIADLLNSTLERTQGLAQIVHRKTHGNCFAIVHFLKSLHEEGLLYYCLGTLSWKWDEEETMVGTKVTENVADLLTHKIKNHLPDDVQEVLRISSCLGFTFDSSVLASIAGDIARDEMMFSGSSGQRRIARCLDSCIDEGLFETDSSATKYRFAHDQIAAAAFALIPNHERVLLQLRIGETLLKNLSESDVERDLFVIVGLVNKGSSLLWEGDKKRITYAALNLRAGRKAMDASAFETAAQYLKTGIDLLGQSSWEEHPAMALDLFSTAAEAECVNAHREEMKRYINEILMQELSVKDKVRAYCTLIHSLNFLEDKSLEALEVGLAVLEELGVSFPRKNLKRATLMDLVKTKVLLRKFPVDGIPSLPAMEDETRLLQMQILSKIFDLAYFVKPEYVPWVVFKMVRISVRKGACKYSSGAFASYGLLILSFNGNIQKANEFGEVAVSLLKRFGARELEARVLFICNCLLFSWVLPAHNTHKRLLLGYEVGMQTGDTGFAMLSIRTYCVFALFIGKPLHLIETEMNTYTQQMRDHGQEKVVALLLPAWQLVLNLLGCSEDPSILNGEAMQLDGMLCHCKETGDEVLRNIIEAHQIWAAFYFGNYELGGQLLQGTTGKTHRANPITWRRALFDGLTAFELARKTKSKEWKTRATKVAANVREWADSGNVNCVHVQLLFEAEKASLEGKHTEAHDKYEKAISTVSRHGFLNDRALANERAGEYYLEHGDKYFAAHHLGLAHQLYSNWGATAKADHLFDKHRGLFDKDSGIPVGTDIDRRWST